MESFTLRALKIEIVATGSTAEIKKPNYRLSKYSKGLSVFDEPHQNIRLNTTPAIIVEKMA